MTRPAKLRIILGVAALVICVTYSPMQAQQKSFGKPQLSVENVAQLGTRRFRHGGVINRAGDGLKVLIEAKTTLGLSGEASIDWSPDGREVVYITENQTDIRAVNVDTSQTRILFSGVVAPGYETHNGLSWSRHDNRILFNSQRLSWAFDQDVIRLDPESGKTALITDEWGELTRCASAVDSPDGSLLAYIHDRVNDGQLTRSIVVLDASAESQPESLINSSTTDEFTNPRWFPDNQRLLFSSGPYGRQQIHSISLDGRRLRHLTHGPHDDVEADIWMAD